MLVEKPLDWEFETVADVEVVTPKSAIPGIVRPTWNSAPTPREEPSTRESMSITLGSRRRYERSTCQSPVLEYP